MTARRMKADLVSGPLLYFIGLGREYGCSSSETTLASDVRACDGLLDIRQKNDTLNESEPISISFTLRVSRRLLSTKMLSPRFHELGIPSQIKFPGIFVINYFSLQNSNFNRAT